MSYINDVGNIKTNGTGTIQAEPDIAIIDLGIKTEYASLQLAKEKNANTTAAVINNLFQLGIPRNQIKTSSYNIEPQYDIVDGKQVFRGYRAETALSIKLKETALVGEVIDRAVASGANNIYNISFTMQSPSLYYRQALDQALEDAVAKAARIARFLEVELDEIPYKIIEESSTAPILDSPALKLATAALPVLPGLITISARIEAYFSYLQ